MAWIRVPGSARRFVNTDTGETLSRRQFDVRYGRLAAEHYTSYEQKARFRRNAAPRPTPSATPEPAEPLVDEWVREPGGARRYVNLATGETLSRRQYDVRHGRLKAQGFQSNEQQRDARKHPWARYWARQEFATQEAMMARIYGLGPLRVFIGARGMLHARYQPDNPERRAWRSLMGSTSADDVTAGMVYAAASRVFDYPTIDRWVLTWRFQ